MAANEPNVKESRSDNALSGCGHASEFGGDGGNSDAIASIHRTYHEDYEEHIRYARNRVRSSEAAQDIVQQAFTNTLNAVEQGAQISNVGGFVRRCVHNMCINRNRMYLELTLSLELEGEMREMTEREMTERSTAASVEIREQWRSVESVVDKLTPNQRNAFLLAEIKGLSYEETAESMNRSINSVRQLLNRARTKIRAKADIGPDSIWIPAPAIELDHVLVQGRTDLSPSMFDRIQARTSQLHAWLGNVFQSGAESALNPVAASVVAGAVIVTLGVVTPAPIVGQDTPAAGRVVDSVPVVSRSNSDSTGTEIDETAPDYIVASPSPSAVSDSSGNDSRRRSSVDQGRSPRAAAEHENEEVTVVAGDPDGEEDPGPGQGGAGEEENNDPEDEPPPLGIPEFPDPPGPDDCPDTPPTKCGGSDATDLTAEYAQEPAIHIDDPLIGDPVSVRGGEGSDRGNLIET